MLAAKGRCATAKLSSNVLAMRYAALHPRRGSWLPETYCELTHKLKWLPKPSA